MSSEHYQLSQDQLILKDSELNLDLTLPFKLPRLPQDFSCAKLLEAGELVVVERDTEKQIRSAFITREGRRHGQCRLYYSQEKVQADMFYQDGNLHGPSLFFSEDGSLLSRTFFCEGKREGKAYLYFASGKVASIQRFKNGLAEGLQEYFYESGTIKSLIPYRSGKLEGEVRLLWEDGSSKRVTHYLDGKREGLDQLWNDQKILIDEGNYSAGSPIGTHRHFFSNGKLKEERMYHTPVRLDRKEWNAEGKLLVECTWAADLSYTEKVYLEKNGARVRRGYWDGSKLRWK